MSSPSWTRLGEGAKGSDLWMDVGDAVGDGDSGGDGDGDGGERGGGWQ